MGKYSNINTKALLNTLNTALNEIDQYNLNLIWNNFKKRTILDSQVNNNIDLVFNKIINSKNIHGSIANLKAKLTNLKTATNYMIQYQNLENEIQDLQTQLYNSDGTINYQIKNEITNKEDALYNYERNIDNLLT